MPNKEKKTLLCLWRSLFIHDAAFALFYLFHKDIRAVNVFQQSMPNGILTATFQACYQMLPNLQMLDTYIFASMIKKKLIEVLFLSYSGLFKH